MMKKQKTAKYGTHQVRENSIKPKPIIVKAYASAKYPIVATVTPDAFFPCGDRLYQAYYAYRTAQTMSEVTPDASSSSPM